MSVTADDSQKDTDVTVAHPTAPTSAVLASESAEPAPASESAALESEPTAPASDPGEQNQSDEAHILHIPSLLAVITVVVFQFRTGFLPGGFLGIELALVLAGFLITSSLLRQWQDSGHIDLPRFWGRQWRRFWPPIVALTIVLVPLALALNRDLLVGIRRQLVGAYTFTFNWVEIWHGSALFDTATPSLFGNLWVLALLMQFVWLWPILFWALLYAFRRWELRIGVVFALAVLSAASMGVLFSPGFDAARVYYGLDTHSFPLIVGAVVALICADKDSYLRQKVQGAAFAYGFILAGALGMLAGFIFLRADSAVTFRGGMFAFVLCAAMFLWGLALLPVSVRGYLNHPVLRVCSAHALGVYLWFWPILVLLRQTWQAADYSKIFWVHGLAALLLSVGFTAVYYRWIQQPVMGEGIAHSLVRLREVRSRVRRPVAWVAMALAMATAAGAMWAPSSSFVTRTVEGVNRDGRLTIVTEATTLSAQLETARRVHQIEDNSLTEDERAAVTKKYAEKKLPAPLKPQGSEITFIGDQLLLESRSALEKRFPGSVLYADRDNTWSTVVDQIKQAAQDNNLRPAVVIALGVRQGIEDPAVLQEVLSQLGPTRQVVFINLRSPHSWTNKTNRVLENTAQSYVNVGLGDWATVAKENPDFLKTDQILPSNQGAPALAEVVDNAFKGLAQQILQRFEKK